MLSSQFGSQAPYEDSQSQAPGDDELFGPADIKAMKSQAKSQAPGEDFQSSTDGEDDPFGEWSF